MECAIQQLALEALAEKENRRKPLWWDKEIEMIFKEKQEIYLKYMQNANGGALEEKYQKLRRRMKKLKNRSQEKLNA